MPENSVFHYCILSRQDITMLDSTQLQALGNQIKDWSRELGFQDCGITDTALEKHEQRLQQWLDANYHGDLDYMAAHGSKRSRPQELIEGTLRVISLRMDYLPDAEESVAVLEQPEKAYVSRYALGRDYHKLLRKRLSKLADKIRQHAQEQYNYRAFVDSAPVLERALAEKAGLGWIGKNSMLIASDAGSWFFLGEIYTDLPLPIDPPFTEMHCGSCTRCLELCPTNAFVEPFVLDARRCISYLTIESKDAIPLELRPLMGNRIFGCDDCQLVCPWTKFSSQSEEKDFSPRNDLDSAELLTLFSWSEEEFLKRTEGSPIRRTGYEGWMRNIAVALGNAPYSPQIIAALENQLTDASDLLAEHCQWALQRQVAANPNN
jgi:epoxyqueuosine reductase